MVIRQPGGAWTSTEGTQLRQARAHNRHSQQDCVDALVERGSKRVSQQTLSKWEAALDFPRGTCFEAVCDYIADAGLDDASPHLTVVPPLSEPDHPVEGAAFVPTGDDSPAPANSESERAVYLRVLLASLETGRGGREGLPLESPDWIKLAAVLGPHFGVDWLGEPDDA